MIAVGPVSAEGNHEVVPLPAPLPPALAAAVERGPEKAQAAAGNPGRRVTPVPSSNFNRLQLSLRSFLVLNSAGRASEERDDSGTTESERSEEDQAGRIQGSQEGDADQFMFSVTAAEHRRQAQTLISLVEVADGLFIAPPHIDFRA